jgi:hypothetical protein
VKFAGTITSKPSGTVGVIFALYKDQTGGAPLWQEVQNVTVDASGRYAAFLGARSANGIPVEVFSTGEARWLGIQADGQAEQTRVLLVSVPYALKASDAETLGGLPASAFLRADSASTVQSAARSTAYINTAAVSSAANLIINPLINASGAGVGYIPVFNDLGGDVSNSVLFQSGSFVGVGTTAPAALLNLVGANPTMRVDNYSNNTGDSPNFNFFTARGTAASPSAILGGDNLGQFAAAGYNGAAFPGSKVKVTFMATENWTPTANGTTMSFQTTANGTTARTERMRIDNTGYVGIGTTTPDQLLTVAGSIHSTAGGFVFPDGSVMQTAATLPGLQPGGNLILGAGTGTAGVGNLDLQTSADVTNTMSDRLLIVGKPKAMTGPVPMANLFSVHIPAGDAAGGRVKFTIVASDGTHYAMETGEIIFLANPNQLTCAVVISQYAVAPPSYTNTVLASPPIGQSGSLNAQCSSANFGGDPGMLIFDTAPTSFVPTTHKVYYTIENQSQAALTLQS